MKRRSALVNLIALGAAIRLNDANSQPPRERPFRIATLPDVFYGGLFSEAMRQHGWTEGRDFIVVKSGLHAGAPHSQLEEAAKRMVAEKPDLIFTVNDACALALQRMTTTIPIVFWSGGYPVEVGLANSLAHPGKNATGTSAYAGTGIWGKLVELLRDAKPSIRRIGVIWGYVPPAHPRENIEMGHRELKLAARSLALSLHIVEVGTAEVLPAALRQVEAERPDALLFTPGFALWEARRGVAQFAVERRLPMIVDSHGRLPTSSIRC